MASLYTIDLKVDWGWWDAPFKKHLLRAVGFMWSLVTNPNIEESVMWWQTSKNSTLPPISLVLTCLKSRSKAKSLNTFCRWYLIHSVCCFPNETQMISSIKRSNSSVFFQFTSYFTNYVVYRNISKRYWMVITSHNTISLSVVVLSMLGDDIMQTEKRKLNQRVYCALFKFRMSFKSTDQRLLHQWSIKNGV